MFGHFRSSPAGPLAKQKYRFSDTSSRSCNSVMPTFTSSLMSSYLSISLAKFSKAILRLRLSSIKTQWPSSSLADDDLCCGSPHDTGRTRRATQTCTTASLTCLVTFALLWAYGGHSLQEQFHDETAKQPDDIIHFMPRETEHPQKKPGSKAATM